jgi:nitrogen fixation NifU-like protein
MDNPHGKGMAVGQCGDAIEVSLRVDRGAIADIKVVPHGCIFTVVCASAMSELAKGRDLDHALELEPQELVAALGGLPEDHMHCARLAVNTLGEAIADYYRKVAHSTSD